MTRDTFPVTGRVAVALAVTLSGCATTAPASRPPLPGRNGRGRAEAPAIAGTRVVATGPVLPRPEGPAALRVPAQVMRIWIAPWEDSRGDLHAPGYLYTEIEPRRWTLGAPAEPEPAILIRPLQIERRDAKPDTGAARPRRGTPRARRARPRRPRPGPTCSGADHPRRRTRAGAPSPAERAS